MFSEIEKETFAMTKTQVEIGIFIWDALNKKLRELEREELKQIRIQVLENGNPWPNAVFHEGKTITFLSDTSSGAQVQIVFSAQFADAGEIAP
jgi:hypothetical protein